MNSRNKIRGPAGRHHHHHQPPIPSLALLQQIFIKQGLWSQTACRHSLAELPTVCLTATSPCLSVLSWQGGGGSHEHHVCDGAGTAQEAPPPPVPPCCVCCCRYWPGAELGLKEAPGRLPHGVRNLVEFRKGGSWAHEHTEPEVFQEALQTPPIRQSPAPFPRVPALTSAREGRRGQTLCPGGQGSGPKT